MHPHLSRNVSKDLNTIVKLHTKRRIRQRIRNNSVNFDRSLFCHAFLLFR